MEQQIAPEKVTKPIQLLAAWLVGLIAVNTGFLGAAGLMEASSPLRAVLVIAAVANVPLFVGCVFLLQTKFRPQIQEDSYYATYVQRLDAKYEELGERQERQEGELNDISMILGALLSNGERRLLQELDRGQTRNRDGSDVLVDDLRGLKKRNLIQKVAGHRIRDVLNARNVDLADYVQPTALGHRMAARIMELERADQ